MINPTFIDTVTVYHQIKDKDQPKTTWKRSVYEECFFGTVDAESLSGNTLSDASTYIVRIPYRDAAVDIAPGDVVVKGAILDEIADVAGQRINDLLARYKPNAFTVRSVADNTKIPFAAHYKAVGV